jgi:hypothetical protein
MILQYSSIERYVVADEEINTYTRSNNFFTFHHSFSPLYFKEAGFSNWWQISQEKSKN